MGCVTVNGHTMIKLVQLENVVVVVIGTLPVYAECTETEDSDAHRGLLNEWDQLAHLHSKWPVFCQELREWGRNHM